MRRVATKFIMVLRVFLVTLLETQVARPKVIELEGQEPVEHALQSTATSKGIGKEYSEVRWDFLMIGKCVHLVTFLG